MTFSQLRLTNCGTPMTPISARVELLLARARNAAQDLPDGMAQDLEQLNQAIEA
jgi:hypothetical protein